MKWMTHRLVLLLAVWDITVLQSICLAQRLLNETVAESTTIVVGRLDRYRSEPEPFDQSFDGPRRFGGSGDLTRLFRTVRVRGTYTFSVLATLKGTAPNPLVVQLPRVLSYARNPTPVAPRKDLGPAIDLDGMFLLLLSETAQDGFRCSDDAVPLMPLSRNVQLRNEPVDENPDAILDAVIRLLIDSLDDPTMRRTAAFLLREARGDKAARAVRPYVGDVDDFLRESALECLATNQDWSILPEIVSWRPTGGAGPARDLAIRSLRKFDDTRIIPFANQLLLDPDFSIRSAAAETLRRLPPDESSIPFWIKAMRIPEPTVKVAYDAYFSICVQAAELGPPKTYQEFRANPEPEIKRLETWWAGATTRPGNP